MKPLTKLIIILAVGLGVTLASVFYLIKPTLNKVSEMNADLRNKKSESKTLEQQKTAFQTAQSDLNTANQKERIANSYVSKFDLVKAIQGIEAAGVSTNTTHQLSITDPFTAAKPGIAADKPKKSEIIANKQGIEEIEYTMLASNDFAGMVKFLEYLEHLPYFTEVSKLELVADSLSGQNLAQGERPPHSGIVRGKIDGVLFITKDEAIQQ